MALLIIYMVQNSVSVHTFFGSLELIVSFYLSHLENLVGKPMMLLQHFWVCCNKMTTLLL